MSSDEEFATPQYRVGVLMSPQRARQLQPRQIAFEVPPRTDSFSFLDEDFRLPARSMSTGALTLKTALDDMDMSGESLKPVDADPLKKDEIFERALEYAGESAEISRDTIIESVERLCDGKNQVIEDILDKHDFVVLSAALQIHKNRKALIIFPSNKLLQWARGFLVNSTLMCPEGREKQQEALLTLSRGSTQVLMALAQRVSTLSLMHFHFIYIVKSELCQFILPMIAGFSGQILVHRTPGYNFSIPFEHVITRDPKLTLKCLPTVHFVEAEGECMTRLAEVIDTDEATCIICPFKTVCEQVFKKFYRTAVRFSPTYSRKDDCRPVVATTALFYTTATFDHYIFVEAPPSLNHLVMACYSGKKVTVLANTNTLIKLQAYSHSKGWDYSAVSSVLQSLFWDGDKPRAVGDVASLCISGMDVTRDAVEDLITELVAEKVVSLLPCKWQNVMVRIVNMSNEMKNSPLINAILRGRPNQYGQYTLTMQHLCTSTKLTPIQIDVELQQLHKAQKVEFRYADEADFFSIKKVFDEDEYMLFVSEIGTKMKELEAQCDEDFDVLYTVLKDPALFGKLVTGDEFELTPIPHAPVDTSEIKGLLSHYRRVEWTPRAVARILHGIGSPKFAATEWSKANAWGKQPTSSFAEIVKFCQSITCNPAKIE